MLCAVLAISALAVFLPSARAAEPALPDRDHWLLGWERLQAQMAAGRELATEFSIAPGILPIVEKGPAEALRQALAAMNVRWTQRTSADETRRTLDIALREQPGLTLSQRIAGDRAVWASPQMDAVLETPAQMPVFAEMLQQPALAALFAVPEGRGASTAAWYAPIEQLLAVRGDETLTVSIPVAERLIGAWFQTLPAELRDMLLPLSPGWRVVDETTVERTVTEKTNRTRLKFFSRVGYHDEEPWAITVTLTHTLAEKADTWEFDIFLNQDTRNNLRIRGSLATKLSGKAQTRQEFTANCTGRMFGDGVDMRVSNKIVNDFQQEGQILQEQIKHDFSLTWKARSPVFVYAGFGEWKVTVSQRGTLRSEPSAAAPVRWEGKLSLTTTNTRKDFLSAEIPWSLSTGPGADSAAAEPTMSWEKMEAPERATLYQMGRELEAVVRRAFVDALDAETVEALWLPAY